MGRFLGLLSEFKGRMSKTPEELARLYANEECTGNAIYGDGLYVGYLAGYQAGYEEAKKFWATTPKYELDPNLKEHFDQEFKPGPWAHLFEKK
jgi:hypothetical protein